MEDKTYSLVGMFAERAKQYEATIRMVTGTITCYLFSRSYETRQHLVLSRPSSRAVAVTYFSHFMSFNFQFMVSTTPRNTGNLLEFC